MRNDNTEELLIVSRTDSTLKVEWSNRDIPKSLALTIFSLGFWLIWTPATIYITFLLFTSSGDSWYFFSVWLLMGYPGVFVSTYQWLIRWSHETIEIDNERYRHHFVGFPSWLQKNWDAKEITKIHFGCYDDATFQSLNIVRARSWGTIVALDIIAMWATDDIKRELFDLIRGHLDSIGSSIPIVDNDRSRESE